jgi:hypothetical protein
MATVDNQTSGSGLLAWLVRRRVLAGTSLVILGIAIAVLPTLLSSWYGTEYLGTVIFSGLLAFLVIAIGVTIRFMPAEASANVVRLLGLVLLLGGLGGLLVALVGVALSIHWSNLLTDWLSAGKREGAGQVLLGVAVFLAGLLLMFVTMQLGRAEEHRNPTLRRLMYGYNAVFAGVLLLLILTVVNVLAGVKLLWAVDATSSGEYSISDRTINLVKGLDKDLNVKVIWPPDDDRMMPIRSLLDNMQTRSTKVSVEYFSPRQERVVELLKKYPRKIDNIGILLVYGEEKPENATFLKEADLFEEGFGNNPTTRFRGEDKIDAAISSLEGGGQKTIVYVTQGAGEPSLSDSGTRPAPGGKGGLGSLRDRLNARGNFDVRPLTISPGNAKVPDDCKVLVVPAPKPPVDPRVEQSFRQYLEKGGKAVFLFDVPAPATGPKMPATGVEGLLAGYNLEVTGDRVLSFGVIDLGGARALTDRIIVDVNQTLIESRSNEVATAFAGYPFILNNEVRLVRPAAAGRPGGDSQAQALLTTVRGRDVWTESDWQADSTPQYKALRSGDASMEKRLAKEPLPAAVVVTSGGKPKLAAFGDVGFITNPSVAEGSGTQNFSLFASLLDWLAERSTSIGIEPRNMTVYSLDPTVRFSYLLFLPGLLAFVTILGLGLGVWVVRRR